MLLTDDCFKEDYIKTLFVNNKKICLFNNDYGQCYYITFEEDGEIKSLTLSGWNVDYMADIYSIFDEEFHNLNRKIMFGEELTSDEKNKIQKYYEIFSEEYRIDYDKFQEEYCL